MPWRITGKVGFKTVRGDQCARVNCVLNVETVMEAEQYIHKYLDRHEGWPIELTYEPTDTQPVRLKPVIMPLGEPTVLHKNPSPLPALPPPPPKKWWDSADFALAPVGLLPAHRIL